MIIYKCDRCKKEILNRIDTYVYDKATDLVKSYYPTYEIYRRNCSSCSYESEVIHLCKDCESLFNDFLDGKEVKPFIGGGVINYANEQTN